MDNLFSVKSSKGSMEKERKMSNQSSRSLEKYIPNEENIVFYRDITKFSPWIGEAIVASIFLSVSIIQFISSVSIHAYIKEFKVINTILQILLPLIGVYMVISLIKRRNEVVGTNKKIILLQKTVFGVKIREIKYHWITGLQLTTKWRTSTAIGLLFILTFVGISVFGPIVMITTKSFSTYSLGVLAGLTLGIVAAIIWLPYKAIIFHIPTCTTSIRGIDPLIIKLDPFKKMEFYLPFFQEIQRIYEKVESS